ncbi:PilZ domain-containing protein [Salinimonas sediminis]|uniref:PilZ domain-containing protein n=1 Tax=Salinimonas sediminis TaxID=2303538 RepID=A0A346NNT7_9ALTE|nr:PilZ domain-containing protein [Salinimonas sediminis]AXR07194.1 PilZ domain-containing protein [Salinimonas sediminis]
MSDKRHFQRVVLNIPGTLSHGDTSIAVTVEDVSLQGLRLIADEHALASLPFDSHDPYHIRFLDDTGPARIEAWLEQLYRHTDQRRPTVAMGCKVDHIAVESLAALRQLIELNSGDAQLSQQDLDALTDAIYDNASSASES